MPAQTPGPADGQHKAATVAHSIIERITRTYSREQAQNDGISFWPDPLPTPVATLLPDPLVLFKSVTSIPVAPLYPLTRPLAEEQRERLYVLPMSMREAMQLRVQFRPTDPPMKIPLGLMDIPEEQKREILWVDLHGSQGTLTGGPMLIAGAQNSGKATALQTALYWLMARYTPRQFRCAIIDPNHDLDFLQDNPYLRDDDGTSLWADGENEAQVNALINHFTQMITRRRESYANVRWDENTIGNLRSQGTEIPLLLLIISHYHTFADNFKLNESLKKLALTMVGLRTMGIYLILTSAEVGTRFIPADLMGKVGTRIGLFLNDQQRYDLLGRNTIPLDPIPGRGMMLTRDRSLHEVQLALPVPGATEGQRYETLKRESLWLAGQ